MSDAITVAIVRQVPLERSGYADAWARSGQELARAFPGFLGSGWMRSSPDSTEWHMAYRFADEESLAVWENSEQRRHWLEMAGPYINDSRREHRTGIEGWFDEPEEVVVHQVVTPPPPRWKQSVSIFLPFLPLSLVMNYLLAWLVPTWPIWARVCLSIVVMTPLMTYLLLPLSTRLLGPWLRRNG
ncbi:antibiotic biosynthesis monooxygenase [Naumannella sp. ID2617S]|nr:antibiotic biosynthesis monooxygenase [Naumannella sp. ID2617S]